MEVEWIVDMGYMMVWVVVWYSWVVVVCGDGVGWGRWVTMWDGGAVVVV